MFALQRMQGNLITLAQDGFFDVIVQGCNCFNTFGSGLAKEIREKYPAAAKIDSETRRGDFNKLGNYTIAPGLDFHIVNAYTQYDMSTGEDVFQYVAFELILQKLANQFPTCRFGFPQIGAGLARGDWVSIQLTLAAFAKRLQPTGGTATVVMFNSTT